MKATSPRRRLIVFVLLALALVGGLVRYWAPNPSLARNIGTLLLVLWLPVLGHVVAFLVNRLRHRMRRVTAFAADAPFVPHLWAQLEPARAAAGQFPAAVQTCTLVVGTEGFTARLAQPLAIVHAPGQVETVEVQFLRPALALPRFPAATDFQVMAQGQVVGTGHVLTVAR